MQKTAPASCFGNRGGSFALWVFIRAFQALAPSLAGILDGSLGGCQNYRAFKSIHLHSPCLLEGFSIVDMVMAVILHSEFNIFRKCCPRNRSISQMHHNSHSSQIVIPKFLINSIIGIQFQAYIHRITRCEQRSYSSLPRILTCHQLCFALESNNINTIYLNMPNNRFRNILQGKFYCFNILYWCSLKLSRNYLRGFLIAAWAGAKITERSVQSTFTCPVYLRGSP